MAISRRGLIRNGLIAVSLGVAPPTFLLKTAHAKPLASEALQTNGSGRTLVVIEMAGGNDGLNTVIPFADEAYYRARPSLAIPRAEAQVLTDELALHPAMTPFAELFKMGKAAIVQGVGYPNPNYSHFRAMEIIKSGVPETYEPVGWLGRYLDIVASKNDHFPGVRVGGSVDHAVRSTSIQIPVIQNANAYSLQTDPRFAADRQNRLNTFNALQSGSGPDQVIVPLIQDTAETAYVSSRELADLVSRYASSVEYPQQNGLAQGLKLLAQIITANVGLQVGYVTLAGFDTHAGQLNQQRNLLGQVAGAVRAFYDDLAAHGIGDKVMVLITSEFGRRVAENGSNGTDHGSACPFFLVGDALRGGIYGARPSLTDLDNGNFRYTTDFRSIYSTVLSRWLNTDPAQVLGRSWDDLGFVA